MFSLFSCFGGTCPFLQERLWLLRMADNYQVLQCCVVSCLLCSCNTLAFLRTFIFKTQEYNRLIPQFRTYMFSLVKTDLCCQLLLQWWGVFVCLHFKGCMQRNPPEFLIVGMPHQLKPWIQGNCTQTDLILKLFETFFVYLF